MFQLTFSVGGILRAVGDEKNLEINPKLDQKSLKRHQNWNDLLLLLVFVGT